MLLQQPQPHRRPLLGAQVWAGSEAVQGSGPGPGGHSVLDDGRWQVAEQVPHDVHGVLVGNGVVLKPTHGTMAGPSGAPHGDPLKSPPTPNLNEPWNLSQPPCHGPVQRAQGLTLPRKA